MFMFSFLFWVIHSVIECLSSFSFKVLSTTSFLYVISCLHWNSSDAFGLVFIPSSWLTHPFPSPLLLWYIKFSWHVEGNIVFFEGFDRKRRRNINDSKMDSVLLGLKVYSFLFLVFISCRVPSFSVSSSSGSFFFFYCYVSFFPFIFMMFFSSYTFITCCFSFILFSLSFSYCLVLLLVLLVHPIKSSQNRSALNKILLSILLQVFNNNKKLFNSTWE